MAKPSLSVVVSLISVVDSFLLAKANGWSMSHVLGCANKDHNAIEDASTCT
jgi:hypothetical protein